MANIKIGMILSDDTDSINKRTKSAKALNNELEKTQKLSKTALGGEVAPSDVVGYNRQRAVSGTGAGARDFAKQAEGLGGIVRLYATFAANIFAVGAAFQALNRAAQMERLVQASEMMTQRVGVNLKGLGRDLQEATGYALSFEQSMQFANIGTSAGIAASDLKELVTIAKGAAAGLGRDVNDSITRIIQGTAKQEQEILDELGIFIKAKDAYEEYARKFQIEGGPDALSAQQRVRAYSDAVRKAGEQWKEFAKIPDPFSELTARGSEAVNKILKSVNEIVVPVLELLAKSGDAIKALIVLMGGLLAKRALPEIAAGLTQVFTFDSAKAKATATAARQATIDEYNKTTQELKAAKAIRDKLLLETPGTIAGAVGELAAVKKGKGVEAQAGISAQRITTKIFGTATNPNDLAKLKSVEDVNNKILSTIKEQVAAKKEEGAFLVQNLIKAKVLEANSTRDNLVLSQETQKVGTTIYNDLVSKRIVAQQNLNNLLAREEALSKQIQTFQTGTTNTIITRQRASTAGTAAATVTAAGTAAVGAAAISSAISAREAFSTGLGQVGERSRELATQLDQGPVKTFKAFTSAIKDNLVSLTTVGQGMGKVGRASAVAGAAIGTLGTVVSGAFRLIGAAFGPLLIMFTLWEMFGDKIVPQSVTKMKELEDQTSNLQKELSNVSQAVDFAAAAYADSNKSMGAYVNYIQTINNSLTSQIDILDKLIRLEREKARIARGEKPKTEEELRKDETNAFLNRAAEAGIDVTSAKRQLDSLYKRLDSINNEEQRVANLAASLATEYASALKSVTEVFYGLQVNREGTLQALKGAKVTSAADYVTKLRRGEIGEFNLSPTDKAAAEQLSPAIRSSVQQSAAAALGGMNEGFFTDRLRAARATSGESEGRRRDAAQQIYEAEAEVRRGLREQTERALSEASKLNTAFKNSEDSITEIGKKIRSLPAFSNIAKTSEGMPIEKAFNEVFDSLKKYTSADTILPDKKKLQVTKDALVSQLDSLASAGIQSAKPLADKLRDIVPQELPAVLGTYKTELTGVLEDINEATSDYTKSSREGFRNSSKAVETQKQAIQRAAIAQADLNEKMSAYESILGTIPQNVLNDGLQQQLKLNQNNYNLSVNQAALEKSRIDQNRNSTQEQKTAAQDVYNATVAQAGIAKQVADIEAERAKKARELANELNTIAKKYEDIALKQNLLRNEDQARAALFDARQAARRIVASPVEQVGIEDVQKQRELQTQANTQIEDLLRQRDSRLEEIEARRKKSGLTIEDVQPEINRAEELFRSQLDSITKIVGLGQQRLAIEKEIAEAAAKTQVAQEAVSRKYEQKSSEEGMASKAVDLEKQRLQLLYEQGRISGDQLDTANRDLELIQRQIDYRSRLNQINETYETKKAELDEKMLVSGDSEYLAQQVAENERLRARDTKNLQDTYNAQEQIYNNMEKFTRRQQAWGSAIEKVFDGMADAMMDWAKTGKFSSKELFNQLIEDIVRYELRLMMHQQWLAAKKPLMDFLSSAMGSFGNWFSTNVFGPQSIDLSAAYANPGAKTTLTPMAAGGAFMPGGVEYFAKGGMFSNSIVNSPTLFKAAKGLGVMGEAGPEAIMPLKRDSNGVLGVRAGGSSNNVEVVVNNYSGEKASTKETTDSRGNKKIEVIVGEAVANQLSKTGSPVQRSMGGSYGLVPQFIRR